MGATLNASQQNVRENFVSSNTASWFADLYAHDGLKGGHVIMLGPGNEKPALEALAAYPQGLQVGGGLTPETALRYLDAGAEKVIFTSWLFPQDRLDLNRLNSLSKLIPPERVVIDLSCKQTAPKQWTVAKNKWQTLTQVHLEPQLFELLGNYASEFLVHAADVEGLCLGIDEALVEALASWCPHPLTYAGGAKNIEDLEKVKQLSAGKIDLTLGSALDIFGGKGASYAECVRWNKRQNSENYGNI